MQFVYKSSTWLQCMADIGASNMHNLTTKLLEPRLLTLINSKPNMDK